MDWNRVVALMNTLPKKTPEEESAMERHRATMAKNTTVDLLEVIKRDFPTRSTDPFPSSGPSPDEGNIAMGWNRTAMAKNTAGSSSKPAKTPKEDSDTECNREPTVKNTTVDMLEVIKRDFPVKSTDTIPSFGSSSKLANTPHEDRLLECMRAAAAKNPPVDMLEVIKRDFPLPSGQAKDRLPSFGSSSKLAKNPDEGSTAIERNRAATACGIMQVNSGDSNMTSKAADVPSNPFTGSRPD